MQAGCGRVRGATNAVGRVAGRPGRVGVVAPRRGREAGLCGGGEEAVCSRALERVMTEGGVSGLLLAWEGGDGSFCSSDGGVLFVPPGGMVGAESFCRRGRVCWARSVRGGREVVASTSGVVLRRGRRFFLRRDTEGVWCAERGAVVAPAGPAEIGCAPLCERGFCEKLWCTRFARKDPC